MGFIIEQVPGSRLSGLSMQWDIARVGAYRYSTASPIPLGHAAHRTADFFQHHQSYPTYIVHQTVKRTVSRELRWALL